MVPAALPLAAPLAVSLLRNIIFPAGAEHVPALVLARVQRVLGSDLRRIGDGERPEDASEVAE
jgi:hypothetical protein